MKISLHNIVYTYIHLIICYAVWLQFPFQLFPSKYGDTDPLFNFLALEQADKYFVWAQHFHNYVIVKIRLHKNGQQSLTVFCLVSYVNASINIIDNSFYHISIVHLERIYRILVQILFWFLAFGESWLFLLLTSDTVLIKEQATHYWDRAPFCCRPSSS